MSFKINSLYLTDGYKPSHKAMLAPGTTKLYGTLISRSLKHAPKGITKIVSFYQQATWKRIHDEFEENFFFSEMRNNKWAKKDDTLWLKYKQKALQFVKDMSLYLGMEYDGKHFEELWDLGYLPIRVKALPEGIETNPNIPHMTFVNTVDGFAWLTLYLETIVSNIFWKGATAATIAKLYRRQAQEWVTKTDNQNMWLVDFMCHDFSARGLSGVDDIIAVGLGHATSFKGSDSLPVISASRYFYGVKDDEMPIFSVNASEHSVSTTKIFTVGEQQMIADWLQIFPKGILSIVADTFDLWKLITEYLPANKEAIMARGEYKVIVPNLSLRKDEILIPYIESDGKVYYKTTTIGDDDDTKNNYHICQEEINWQIKQGFIQYTPGKLVIRPDSGDPVDIICGLQNVCFITGNDSTDFEIRDYDFGNWWENNTENPEWLVWNNKLFKYGEEGYRKSLLSSFKEYSYSEAVYKGVIELLWDIFGGTINEQGFKVLDPHIGAIYGDSITPERQKEIYERLAAKGFAATNIVLGVGSFTYQYNTRDTFGFAAKGAWFEVKEEYCHNCEKPEDFNENNLVKNCKHLFCKGQTKDFQCSVYENKTIRKSYNIYKDPVTDDGVKRSLKGLLQVKLVDNEYIVNQECSWEQEEDSELKTIYENGVFKNQTTLNEIRKHLLNI